MRGFTHSGGLRPCMAIPMCFSSHQVNKRLAASHQRCKAAGAAFCRAFNLFQIASFLFLKDKKKISVATLLKGQVAKLRGNVSFTSASSSSPSLNYPEPDSVESTAFLDPHSPGTLTNSSIVGRASRERKGAFQQSQGSEGTGVWPA